MDLSSPSVSVVPPSEGTTTTDLVSTSNTDSAVLEREAQVSSQHCDDDDAMTIPSLLNEVNNNASRPAIGSDEVVTAAAAVVKKKASSAKSPSKSCATSVSVERMRKEVEEQQRIVAMLQSQKAARDLQMTALRSAFSTMMSTRAEVHVNVTKELKKEPSTCTHGDDENEIEAATKESNSKETNENADTNADSLVVAGGEECAEHDHYQQPQEHSSISPIDVGLNVSAVQVGQTRCGEVETAEPARLVTLQSDSEAATTEAEEEAKTTSGGNSEAMTTLIEALKMYVKGRESDLSSREAAGLSSLLSAPADSNTNNKAHTCKQAVKDKGKGYTGVYADDEELRLLREEESALLELLALKKARREAKERRRQAKSCAKKNKQKRVLLAKAPATSASVPPRIEGNEAEGRRTIAPRDDTINHYSLTSARRTSPPSSAHSFSSSREYEEDFESFASEEDREDVTTEERNILGGGRGGLGVEETASRSKCGTPSTTFDENMFGKLLEDLAKEIEAEGGKKKPVGLGWLED